MPTAVPTAQTQQVLATAYDYSAEQQDARLALVAAALAVFANIDPKNPIPSWVKDLGTPIYVLISTLQEMAAQHAEQYVRNVFGIQGLTYNGQGINPLNFAGIAADGRNMESLLAGAAIHMKERLDEGQPTQIAYRSAADYLTLIINSEVPDAARAAEVVSMISGQPTDGKGKSVVLGWVRLLTPPSCGRCVALAGRFYRWSDGFERHPNCDCRHVPATSEQAGGLLADPEAYFASLTEEEQNYYFGKANAEAIRDGADINQVINAQRQGQMYVQGGQRYTREGTTRRGYYGRGADKALRPTPYQIIKDSKGDQAKAIESLTRFGYIIGSR